MAIIKYKKGNSWFSIPIYVNTGGEVSDYVTKQELNNKGYISQIKTINGQELVGSGNINIAVDLSNYYTKSDVNGLIPSLDNYYTKNEIDLKIPSTESFITEDELNGKGYLTEHQSLDNYYTKGEVDSKIASAGNFDATQYYNKNTIDNMLGEYATLDDIPQDYLTDSDLSGYASQSWVNTQNFAKQTSIPTHTSDLLNDSGFITAIPSNYITETELTGKGYLTSDDLEDVTSPIVRSYNEFQAWDANLNTSTAALEILLYGDYAPDYPLNNYSEVLSALKTENKIIHIGSDSLGIELTIHPIKMEGSYNSIGIIHGRIKDTTLENQWYQISGSYSSSLSSSASYASTLYIQPDSYVPVDMQQVTYSQLKTYADNGKLIPGRKYAIIDYSCIYIQPVSNIEMEVTADDIKQIICTAITTTTLSETVEIVRSDEYVPIVECKYSIDSEKVKWTSGMISKSPKGVIWYMKDANGNECNYDFKHIKFRRWAVTDITPNDTPDTGNGNPGAYAYCITNSCYKWSDNRERIGSGEPEDATIVKNVFAGTWARCTTDLSSSSHYEIPNTFHSDYALYCHKPYKDTSDSYKKYISWTTDMTSSIGVNAGKSKGTCTVYGNQIITTNSSYIDCYTFDYQGTDASERTKYNSELALIQDVNINTKGEELSNTCFIFTKESINNNNTSLRNISIPYCIHNTFLLRTYATFGYAYMSNFSCSDKFQYNLIITRLMSHVHFSVQAGFNYLCSDIQYATFDGLFMYQTMFGYYSYLLTGALDRPNLWYGAFSGVKYSSNSSWVAPQEGMQTNNLTTNGFCYGNIMGPLQYCYISPHFDRITFRAVYNKGNHFSPSIQSCSLGECSYSVIGYSGIGQFIKYGKITRCNIPTSSFANHHVYTSTGVANWDSTIPTVPKITDLDVSAVDASVSNINNYTGNVNISTRTKGLPRVVLYSLGGGNWGATYEHGLEAIVASTAVTANLEEPVDQINNDYSLDAEMLR